MEISTSEECRGTHPPRDISVLTGGFYSCRQKQDYDYKKLIFSPRVYLVTMDRNDDILFEKAKSHNEADFISKHRFEV